MEVCLPCNTAAHLNSSRGSGTSLDPSHHKSNAFSMNDLEACLNGILKNGDVALSSGGFTILSGKENSGLKGGESKYSDKTTDRPSYHPEKCLTKSETFPACHRLKFSGNLAHDQDEDLGICELKNILKESDHPFSRSISLPGSLKLVSAMKGSREKQGVPPMKLSVTWGPGVYDPIPTSVSHAPSSSKHQRYHRSGGKKSGKYKQKGGGKSCRSSKKSKDNKSRGGGGSSTSMKPFHEENGVVVCSTLPLEPQVCL